jgi:hypothetical protein
MSDLSTHSADTRQIRHETHVAVDTVNITANIYLSQALEPEAPWPRSWTYLGHIPETEVRAIADAARPTR